MCWLPSNFKPMEKFDVDAKREFDEVYWIRMVQNEFQFSWLLTEFQIIFIKIPTQETPNFRYVCGDSFM